MIGKILTISDAAGQVYVDNAREAWRKHGFLLVDSDIETVLRERNFEGFYLITLSMEQANYDLYQGYIKLLRSLTNLPIMVFPVVTETKPGVPYPVHSGADQTIGLPTDMEWAIANCLAMIRHHLADGNIPAKPLTLYVDYMIFLDVGRYSANVDGREINMDKKEFEILRYLMEHRGIIKTYSQIFRAVWGEEYADSANYVLRNHIKNIRRKIQWHTGLPDYIRTKRGVGYSFDPQMSNKHGHPSNG